MELAAIRKIAMLLPADSIWANTKKETMTAIKASANNILPDK